MENFIYKNIVKKAIFLLDPERAHDLAVFSLRIGGSLPLFNFLLSKTAKEPDEEKSLMGLKFKNPLGLAAGFDKNAEIYDSLSCLGFGFIEVGTVTLKPQPGNPKPRLFRLPENSAIINRMGFNNDGAEKVARNMEKRGRINVPLGINIGKNTDCPLEEAWKNYADCFKILNPYGDYFVINVSCPNIKDLTKLHNPDFLKKITEAALSVDDKKPVFIKISPDLGAQDLKTAVEMCLKYNLGIIAANTTTARTGLSDKWKEEAGGLSGKPLKEAANQKISEIRKISKDIPLIGVGGVFTKEDFREKRSLGADLVQVYTGMIYEGPFIAKKLLKE
ncbi:MAG: dihydroorotate dehydrogenase (quinone) [Elusimicrobia bacterium CG08_land_8_20_14_0_20_51_18]|nr:MAG: dihydroorotate dehydrogenase (quinone) [Elusimicrobia bacterium CG08_land_8_20_14_0_20_51_18]